MYLEGVLKFSDGKPAEIWSWSRRKFNGWFHEARSALKALNSTSYRILFSKLVLMKKWVVELF
jgi:hypothetical protein